MKLNKDNQVIQLASKDSDQRFNFQIEKLQDRLNNAAKFFKEQKAQIETLTKENEELQSNIQSKDKDYEVLQNTYNEVLAENEELKRNSKDGYVSPEKWNSLVDEKNILIDQLKNANNEINIYKDALKSADIQISDFNNQINGYENKITLLEEDNIKLSKDNDDFKKYIETLKEDINKLKENNDNFEKEYKSLEFINDDLNKQIDILESKVRDLLASDKEYKEENTALNTALGEAEEKYDKLMNQFEKCNKFISLIITTAEEFNYINIQNINQKSPANKNNADNVFMKDAPEFSI